jgi:hypothetical protein
MLQKRLLKEFKKCQILLLSPEPWSKNWKSISESDGKIAH